MSNRFPTSKPRNSSEGSDGGLVLSREDFDNECLVKSDEVEAPITGEILRILEGKGQTVTVCSPNSGTFRATGRFEAESFDEWLTLVHDEDRASVSSFFEQEWRSTEEIKSVSYRMRRFEDKTDSFEKVEHLVTTCRNRRMPVITGVVSLTHPSDVCTGAGDQLLKGFRQWEEDPAPTNLRPIRDSLSADVVALLEWDPDTPLSLISMSHVENELPEGNSSGTLDFSRLIERSIDFGEEKYLEGSLDTPDCGFPFLFVKTSQASGPETRLAFIAGINEMPSEGDWALHAVAALLFESARRARETEVRKRLECIIEQSQRLSTVGRLAAGIAHDFNNLLTVIRGHASFLDASASESGDSRSIESISQIKSATDQAGDLAKQLLLFGKGQEIDFQEISLNQITIDFSKLIRRMLEESIELEVDLDKDAGLIEADSGMIGQVLMNLVVNARDAMVDGGKIRIATYRDPETTSGDDSGRNFVTLSVEDNGPGISEANLVHIFDPFFSTKPKGEGTGLGLANVSALMTRHGGSVDVSSSPGEGTKFELHFPIAKANSKEINAEPGSNRAIIDDVESIRGSKVLLVEDESSVRMLVKKLLEMQGCSVVEASSGKMALDLWPDLSDEISVVVSDVIMPEGVSGWDLAKTLHEKRPDVGILLTSGYNERPEDHGLGDDPNVAFLQKPYEAKNLQRNIYELMQKAAS